MSDAPFIKFYPSDFLGGTSGLSPAERGVYITLLCLMYEADGPIPRDDARLARRCGAPKAAFRKSLTCLIEIGKIIEKDGALSNSRAEKAIMDRQNRTQNSTHAANQRWDAQKKKTKQKQGPKNASAVPQQCPPDAKPEARSQSIGEEGLDKSNPPPPIRTVEVGFLEELAWAAGYQTGTDPPERWLDDEAASRVRDWLDHGLTHAQILAAVRTSREHHPDPPHSLKALDGFIEAAAGKAKREVRPAADPNKVAEFWEAQITKGARISPSAIKPNIARIILERGTVTADRLRELGIAC